MNSLKISSVHHMDITFDMIEKIIIDECLTWVPWSRFPDMDEEQKRKIIDPVNAKVRDDVNIVRKWASFYVYVGMMDHFNAQYLETDKVIPKNTQFEFTIYDSVLFERARTSWGYKYAEIHYSMINIAQWVMWML